MKSGPKITLFNQKEKKFPRKWCKNDQIQIKKWIVKNAILKFPIFVENIY